MLPNKPYEVVNKVPMTMAPGLADSKLFLVHTMHEWEALFELLMQRKVVACDTETSGFHYFKDNRIVGMSFGWQDLHFYVPVRHEDSVLDGPQHPQLSMDVIRPQLQEFFARKDLTVIGHNWKFDSHFYRADGIECSAKFHDTRLLWQLYDENAPGSLKTIASGWRDIFGKPVRGLIGPQANAKEQELAQWRKLEARARRAEFQKILMATADDLRGEIIHQDKNRNQLKKWIKENLLHDHIYANAAVKDVHYGFVPIYLMTEYAATDTFLTYKLFEHIISNMKLEGRLKSVYENEVKLSRVLEDVEEAGIRIDRPFLENLGVELEEEIASLDTKVKQTLGDINVGSTDQLSEALLALGAELTEKTPAGKWAMGSEVLTELAQTIPVVGDVLKLRAAQKINGTYVKGILDKLTPNDIIHCTFNQNVSTGRTSSKDPNFQNIPRSYDKIRRAFVPLDSNYIYLCADYSQVEIRLTAHYSADPLLLDAYAKKQDVHTRSMCEMFGYNYDDASKIIHDPEHPDMKKLKDLRTVAKIINFGIIYGIGAQGLAKQIPRPDRYKDEPFEKWVDVCQDYITQYFEKYRGVRKFVRTSGKEVEDKGILYNYFGRPRHLPHAFATGKDQQWLAAKARRQGTNFLVQSTAGDVFKIAVVRCHELCKGSKTFIVNLVHDEIQFMLHRDDIGLIDKLKHAMEDFNFRVPLIADFAFSEKSWADKLELGG